MGKLGTGLLVAGAGVVAAGLLAGGIGIGTHFGGGNGDGSGSDTAPESSVCESASIEDQVSEIRIEKNDIYFEEELCENVDDLKQKIIDYGTTREYVFVYEKAIKATYDEVNEALSELESALGITINRE